MKILYAAGRQLGAEEQLNRFLQAMEGSKHIIKVSAYQETNCFRGVDWNLSALLDIFGADIIWSYNDMFDIYTSQIKSFAPDLIISDLEEMTSKVAQELNLPIFQVSSRLFYEGLEQGEARSIGFGRKYPIFDFPNRENLLMQKITKQADHRIAYSYFCDLANPPKLRSDFEYIRPYHILGKKSTMCRHNLVAISPTNNPRRLIKKLNEEEDVILFSNFYEEKFNNIIIKNKNDWKEYACNLFNANLHLNYGIGDHLADAFYNGQFSWIMPNITDNNSFLNGLLSQHYGYGEVLFDLNKKIQRKEIIKPVHNSNVKYLHEKIEEI